MRFKTILFLMLVGSLLAVTEKALAASAPADLSLDTAKEQKLVGETVSGYLAAVSENSPEEVKRLVARINSQRKEHYKSIAQANGTSLSAVEQLAGAKAIEKTPPGEMVRDSSGDWKQK